MKIAALQSNFRHFRQWVGILTGLLALWVLFLWPNASPAYAAVLFEQPDDSGEIYVTSGDYRGLGTGATGSANQLKVKFKPTEIDEDLRYRLVPAVLKHGETLDYLYSNYPHDQQPRYCFTIAENDTWVDVVLTFPEEIFFTTANYEVYLVYLKYSGDPGCANDEYAHSGYVRSGYFKANAANSLIYFQIGTDLEPPENFIEITFPENTASIPDFSFWKVSGSALDTGTTIEILSKDSGSTVWTVAGGRYLEEAGPFDDWLILKNIVYHIDSYQAYAEMRYQGSFRASSTLVSFNITAINPEIIPFYPIPTSTSTSSEWVITCDPESGLFVKSLCYLAQYLFVPNPDNLNKFSNLKELIETKAPVGYFYAVKNVLSNVGATSTKAFDLATSTAALEPILTPMKTGISFLMWLSFGFWTFNRIRKLEL